MVKFVALLAFLAALYASPVLGASSCDEFTTEKACMSNSVAGDKCSWCNSAAVGATCFSQTDAKSLPSSVFSCKYQMVYGSGADSCDKYTNQKACMSGTANNEKCSWCNSAAVGATCFGESDAKSLPSSVFSCEFQKVALKSTSCDNVKNQKACLSTTSGNEKCAWCNSAAVGGTCFIESDAQSLPSSVFQCEYQKVALKSTSCDSNTNEKSCLASSSNGVKCAWCNSAAVGSTCFEETDAKSLPSSVFSCKYQSAYGVAAASCDEYTTEKACMSGSANNELCAWCSSAAVGSTCFPTSDAKSLPSSVFACKYQNNAYTAGAKTLRGN